MSWRLAALALLALMLVVPIQASAYTTKICLIGVDNKPLADVEVHVYNASGEEWTAKTGSDGCVTLDLANGTYIMMAKGEYIVLATFTVSGDTSVTVNASKLNHANITSVPVAVDFDVVVKGFENVTLKLSTNATIYSGLTLNVTFPKEVTKYPFKYVFEKLEVDGTESNETSTTLDLSTGNHMVTAYYSKTFAITLPTIAVILLALALILALVVAFTAGGKTAASMIREFKMKSMRFVRRRGE